jgi:hypothetical protein
MKTITLEEHFVTAAFLETTSGLFVLFGIDVAPRGTMRAHADTIVFC